MLLLFGITLGPSLLVLPASVWLAWTLTPLHIDEVRVLWPDGTQQTVDDLPANCFYHWKEGDAPGPQSISRSSPEHR